MKHFVARLLVVVFLVDLFGVAALQAAPDAHDGDAGYSHERNSSSKSEAPDCSHACHVSFHFMALPGMPMPVDEGANETKAIGANAATARAPSAKTYHPPRALPRALLQH